MSNIIVSIASEFETRRQRYISLSIQDKKENIWHSKPENRDTPFEVSFLKDCIMSQRSLEKKAND
jgi:hypothetical protein